jgi:hypothetical protein
MGERELVTETVHHPNQMTDTICWDTIPFDNDIVFIVGMRVYGIHVIIHDVLSNDDRG